MTGQVAFEALGNLPDSLIAEAAEKLGFLDEGIPAVAPRGRERSALSRFFGSGWGVALICAVVSVGVLSGVIWAGWSPSGGPGGILPPESETADTEKIESAEDTADTEELTSAEATTDEIISEEKAKELASAYWDIRDGDRDPDTGFKFRIECQKAAVTSRGESVYVILLRWHVATIDHWSTVDTVWVNRETGEVVIPYEELDPETEAESETEGHVHTYSEGEVIKISTCSEKGEMKYVCPCGSVKTEAIPTLPHTEVIDPAVPPTITESGLKEGKHCEVCGKVLLPQSILPATGHTDLAFEVNEDGRTCTITGMGTCTATEIYIPSSMDGYKVTRIGEIAFIGQPITAVHFPSSVTEIYDGAFHGCTELTEITLPKNISTLGFQVFQGCTGLTTATVQCNIDKLPNRLFEGCSSLSEVNLPSGLSSIGMSAFANCTSLQEITFPSSLGAIGVQAFMGCTALAEVTIPSRLSILDDEAFGGCTNLVGEPVLPNGMVRIGSCVFGECGGITAITVPRDVTQAEPDAFERMEGLTDIYFRGTEAEWNADGYTVGDGVQVHFGQ